MNSVVRFDSVTKDYRLGRERLNLRAAVPGRIGRIMRSADLTAVRDLSFKLGAGESLGVIGPNGAGKSTVLKLAAGVTAPTAGAVCVRGRAASLIELGVGFHPDLSGAENVYFAAAILGLHLREVRRRYDAIVSFSGVERFLETPVKRYSSGMLARLGFAVATHVDADLLVVDEVLAVGDSEFQARSYERIRQLRDGGAALLFVTHNMWTLPQLTEKAIRLSGGAVVDSGMSQDVVQRYLAREVEEASQHQPDGESASIPLLMLEKTEYRSGDPLLLTVALDIRRPVENAIVQVAIGRVDGLVCAGDDVTPLTSQLTTVGRHTFTGILGPVELHAGSYRVWVNVLGTGGHPVVHAQAIADFMIVAAERPAHTYGFMRLPTSWQAQ